MTMDKEHGAVQKVRQCTPVALFAGWCFIPFIVFASVWLLSLILEHVSGFSPLAVLMFHCPLFNLLASYRWSYSGVELGLVLVLATIYGQSLWASPVYFRVHKCRRSMWLSLTLCVLFLGSTAVHMMFFPGTR